MLDRVPVSKSTEWKQKPHCHFTLEYVCLYLSRFSFFPIIQGCEWQMKLNIILSEAILSKPNNDLPFISLEKIRGISEHYSNISGMDSKTWCKPNSSYLSFDNSTLKWKKSPFLIFWNAFLQACTCHTGFLWLKLQIFEGNYCHLNVIS